MTLRLYNTLTRTKEDFVPLDPNNVRMYVCGPTVYDFAHIGNARPVIVFDVLFRLLRHLACRGEWDGGRGKTKVTYVRNITDVDDKINDRAIEKKISIKTLTRRTAKQFHEDVSALGCLRPTHEPRATNYIDQMIGLIERLVGSGHAYPAEGHVLFDVSSKDNYGKLSRRSLDEMLAGARVEVAPYKKNPMDFVLWKPSQGSQPGWYSPWGRGRPGWHIECSAMSERWLGQTFDIHGGGIDLVFPHHENEIAQSESAHNGHQLARFWMHNGFLQVEGQKMSKSLGNFFTIRDLLVGNVGRTRSGDVLRLNMLRTHYRQPINWTDDNVGESFDILKSLYEHFDVIDVSNIPTVPPAFIEALLDDLNTPQAIAELHALKRRGETRELYSALRFLGFSCKRENVTLNVVSTFSLAVEVNSPSRGTPNESGKYSVSGSRAVMRVVRADGTVEIDAESKAEIESLIAARADARKAKNFKESDRIRDELLAKGIVLKDSPTGTTWEVKR